MPLQQMHMLKAPRPDRMAPLFFQKFWLVVGKSVINAVLHALNTGDIPTPLNHTYVVLIPKKKSPESVGDYRLISFCKVVYKLISKVLLTNRLKKWMLS